jgi:ATP-dependent exoDNAse (exonuclease V) alpha subunit
MHNQRVLTSADVTLAASTASGRAYRLSLAKGDHIRFGLRCDDLHVINGTSGIIRDIAAEEDGHANIRAEIEGREVTFSSRDVVDERGLVRLGTDYARTIWSSQGLTSQTAVVVAEAALDRRDIYVALSRAKEKSILCLDSRARNLAILAESGFDRGVDDITAEERRDHLVHQLSRWHVKSSTLDYVPALEVATDRVSSLAKRQRSRELSYEL